MLYAISLQLYMQHYIRMHIYAYTHNVVLVDVHNAASGSNLENNVMKMQYISELHHIDVKDDVP